MLKVSSNLICVYAKDYSCVQVNVPIELASQIMKWGRQNIADRDVYSEGKEKGRENEMHVTVKYGLHTASDKELRHLFEDYHPFKVSLGKITKFTTDDKYDVVKIDVSSDELHDLHDVIGKTMDNTDEHPVYRPHLTISYVKKGTCEDLVGRDDFEGRNFMVDEIVFSSKSGKKNKISIK